jgi:hypothetical protein
MSKPLTSSKSSREIIRIRKVTISSSKLKKASIGKNAFSSNPSNKNSFQEEQSRSALPSSGGKREKLDIQKVDYEEDDSVILTLNELLTPTKKKSILNLEETKSHSMQFLNLKTQRARPDRREPVKLFERIN